MIKVVLVLSLLSFIVACFDDKSHKNKTHSNKNWSYEGAEGPAHWASLSEEFSLCGEGKEQSPINIDDVQTMNLQALEFHYESSKDSMVVNNGYTIQVNYAEGSYAIIGGIKFQLVQFHFHSPSEHQIQGKNADLVAHLVHQSESGKLAVVAILFEEGEKNQFISPIWSLMPKRKGKVTMAGILRVNDLLPEDKTYFNYKGSLTKPPCSENVNWNLLTTHVSVSFDQISDFAEIFSKSTRPVQAVNDRIIGIK